MNNGSGFILFLKKNQQFIIWDTVADCNSYNVITYIGASKNETKREKKKGAKN